MIQNLWPTPFLHSKIDDNMSERMIETLLQEYNLTDPPADFGSIDILDNPNEVIQEFKNTIVYPAFNSFLKQTLNKEISDWKAFRVKGWLTGTGNDYRLSHHNHSGAQLSAVFYFLCDPCDRGGQIVFTDPRQNANRGYDIVFQEWFKALEIVPTSGDLVIFPSYLYHFVTTYQSNIRIALPVDLFLFAS